MVENLFASVTGSDVLRVFVILSVGYICAKLLGEIISTVMKNYRDKFPLSKISYTDVTVSFFVFSLRYSIYIIAVMLSLAQIGFTHIVLQFLLVAIITILLAVFLYSLRDFIPNAAAGMYLHNRNLLSEGEEVRIGRFFGRVKKIDLLNTTVVDNDGKIIIIPNAIITKENIIKEGNK